MRVHVVRRSLPVVLALLLVWSVVAGAVPGADAAHVPAPAPSSPTAPQDVQHVLLSEAGLDVSDQVPQDAARTERVLLRLLAGVGDDRLAVLDRASEAGPAPLPRTSELGRGQLLVVAVDGAGKGLVSTVVADPRELRAEWSGRDAVLTGAELRQDAAEVTVDLPVDGRARAVRVYAVAEDASLELVDQAPLPVVAAPGPLDAAGVPGSVVALAEHGPASNRVDLAVLGDGFTEDELPEYARKVDALVEGMFAEEPFREYRSYFNVRRLDVVSAQSGADHPGDVPSTYVDTALGATYDCSGIQRLICADATSVAATVAERLRPEERDLVVVLVNDLAYGGSGGGLTVVSSHSEGIEVLLHELGHSLGLLADEYGGGTGPSCASWEPSAVNATRDIDRATLKWRAWVDASTPLPTPQWQQWSVPGAYEGAAYCDTGVYRPTENSKMRVLHGPFGPVNTEQLVRRTYAFVRPVDDVSPTGTVRLEPGQRADLRVTLPRPATHELAVRWTVDGVVVGGGSERTLSYEDLGPGEHVVAVSVSDPTPWVREDPSEVLRFEHAWPVIAAAPCPDALQEPDDSPAQARSVEAGETASALCPGGDQDWVRVAAAPGVWTVEVTGPAAAAGARVRLFAADGVTALGPEGTRVEVTIATLTTLLVRTAGGAGDGAAMTYDVHVSHRPQGPRTPVEPQDCRDGGWRGLVDDRGRQFRNQGQCVSWQRPRSARGGD